MEENNNNENKVNQIVKNEAKKVGASILKKIIPTILPAIGVFFLILLAIGVINLIPWLIQNMFASIVNLFNPTEPSTASNNQVQSIVYIDEDGKYNLKVEDFSEQILKELEEKQIDVDATGFITEDFEDLLDKYIKAEVQTTFPKTGISEDIDGMIIIKRASTTTGKKDEKLKYVSAKEFNKMLYAGNNEILSCFSINPDTFELWIARQGENIQYYDANGNVYKTEGGGIEKQELDYQKLVQNYAVPLNFFVALHVISQDEEFMQDVLEMILRENKEEPLILTYVDSEHKQTVQYDYSGTQDTITNIISGGTNNIKGVIYGNIDDIEEGTKTDYINNQNIDQYIDDASEYTKKVITMHSGSLYVSKADTWFKTSNRVISEMQTQIIEGEEEIKIKKDEKEGPDLFSVIDTTTKESIIIEKTIKTLIKETMISNTESKRYTIVDEESKIQVEEFINLIESYGKVKNNLVTSPSNIFYLLQQSENTQKLEKIMRYVLSTLTDTNYGISTPEELERIFTETFNRIGGNSAENYIKAWENFELWLYETNQSEKIPTKYLSEDGLYYIVYENGSKKHNNIAYGWATFITNNSQGDVNHPIYGQGFYNWKQQFSNEGILVEELYTGAHVEKGAADSVFENEILPYFRDSVDNYLETHLPEYEFSQAQKDALISVCYQYGNILGFAEAYIESLNADGSINPELLKNNYSRFDYSSTVNNRAYANWLLFTEGIYIDKYGVVIKVACSIVEAAYEVADHFNNSGVVVHYAGDSVTFATNNGRIVNGQDIQRSWELPIEQPYRYGIVCATYVALTIWRTGLIDEDTINQYYYHGTGGINKILMESKYAEDWKIIDNWDDLQEGDIVQMAGHVFIYMDGEKCLDQSYCAVTSGGADLRGMLIDAKPYRYKFIHAFRYIG